MTSLHHNVRKLLLLLLLLGADRDSPVTDITVECRYMSAL